MCLLSYHYHLYKLINVNKYLIRIMRAITN